MDEMSMGRIVGIGFLTGLAMGIILSVIRGDWMFWIVISILLGVMGAVIISTVTNMHHTRQ